MSKEPSQRPSSASEVAKRLARLEREMSDGSTGIAMMPAAVVAAAANAATVIAHARPEFGAPSTSRATAPPTPLLLPVQLNEKRRWPWAVAALVLLLLLLWLLFGALEASPTQPGVANAIETPAAEVVVPPAPVPSQPVELDEVTPLTAVTGPQLKVPLAAAVRPMIVKRPGQFEVTENECVPTAQWRAALSKDLKELGPRAASDARRYAIFEKVEPQLSQQILDADNLSECASVQKKMQSLKQQLGVE